MDEDLKSQLDRIERKLTWYFYCLGVLIAIATIFILETIIDYACFCMKFPEAIL